MRMRPLLVLLLVPLPLRAQIPSNDPDLTLGGRVGVEIEKKLDPSWSVFTGAEFRAAAPFVNHNVRFQGTVGAEYRPYPWLTSSLSYTYIGLDEFRSDLRFRHRLTADLTGTGQAGSWRFSVRERLQLTHRISPVNSFQHTRNGLVLKSRFKVEYRYSRRWRPFVYGEVSQVLNAPSLADYRYDPSVRKYLTPNGLETGEPGWMIAGHDDVYVNRLRGAAGVTRRIDKHRSVRLYGLMDYCNSLDINTNSTGTQLKSLVWDPQYNLSFGCSFLLKL